MIVISRLKRKLALYKIKMANLSQEADDFINQYMPALKDKWNKLSIIMYALKQHSAEVNDWEYDTSTSYEDKLETFFSWCDEANEYVRSLGIKPEDDLVSFVGEE